ncbi:hypothetical protein N7447_008436 [Penicillium robsamsonii]|uniref:uncharacterized protein n=1 Tax=Penicillium robsamsonii TaxID=1792511 RepID=UPI00254901F6|nr:uncharacterized protein N7447_008436 [Penicillium robsamsonii]KAJ5816203.1 hypothetical protein N7447_008436 [Penicillium robsamsonii]
MMSTRTKTGWQGASQNHTSPVRASSLQINKHVEHNNQYVLPPPKFADKETVESLSDPETLKRTLGQEEYYQDLIAIYERDEFARSNYPHMYQGYVHAIMYTGLGLEFNQSSILVEFKTPEATWEVIMADKNFRPPMVDPDEDLERATAEVINTSTYVTCSAMLPPHEFRVAFFLVRVANASHSL